MTQLSTPPQPQIRVHGPIRADLIEYAQEKVAAGLRFAPRPVLLVRINLDHGRPPPAVVTVWPGQWRARRTSGRRGGPRRRHNPGRRLPALR